VRSRRLTTAGLGLIAALTFGVAGCVGTTDSTTTDGNKNAGQGTQDASAALAEASTKLAKESFKLSMKFGEAGTMTGAMDPQKKLGQTTLKISAQGTTMTIDMLLVDTDLYMKMDMGGAALPGMDASKWMHLDTKKLPANSSLGITPGEHDPVRAEKLLQAATKVERVGDREFKGTLDLTKVTGIAGIEAKDVTGLGEKGKAVPFTAKTDDKGRLVNLKIEVPAVAGVDLGSLDATYSDFGTAVDVKKPDASAVIPAPEAIYSTLGS
jgi:hypothetical protein